VVAGVPRDVEVPEDHPGPVVPRNGGDLGEEGATTLNGAGGRTPPVTTSLESSTRKASSMVTEKVPIFYRIQRRTAGHHAETTLPTPR
jgi:hypothetical protein